MCFDKFSKSAQFREAGSNMLFIYGKYGKITQIDGRDDIYDLHVIGPYLNPLHTNALNTIEKKIEGIVNEMNRLDGEISANIPQKHLEKVASIIKIPTSRKQGLRNLIPGDRKL